MACPARPALGPGRGAVTGRAGGPSPGRLSSPGLLMLLGYDPPMMMIGAAPAQAPAAGCRRGARGGAGARPEYRDA
eukprot:298228-Hanusia_phi.AAC.9